MPGSPGRTTAGRRVAEGADHGCPTEHGPGLQTSTDAANPPAVDLEEAGLVVPAAGPAGAVQLRLARPHLEQLVLDEAPLTAATPRPASMPMPPPRRSSALSRLSAP